MEEKRMSSSAPGGQGGEKDYWINQVQHESVNIVDTRTIKTSDDFFTVYKFETVLDDGRRMQVERRFKDFEALHAILVFFFGADAVPAFPSKWSLRDRMTEAVVRERSEAIVGYFEMLSRSEHTLDSLFVQQFLGLIDLSAGAVLITGGVSGVGKEVAKFFASMRAHVFITGLLSDPAWSQVESKMRAKSANPHVYFNEWDPRHASSTEALVRQIAARGVPLRCVVLAHDCASSSSSSSSPSSLFLSSSPSSASAALHPLVVAYLTSPAALLDALVPLVRETGRNCRVVVPAPHALEERMRGERPSAQRLLGDARLDATEVLLALLAVRHRWEREVPGMSFVAAVRKRGERGLLNWMVEKIVPPKALEYGAVLYGAVSSYVANRDGYLLDSTDLIEFPAILNHDENFEREIESFFARN